MKIYLQLSPSELILCLLLVDSVRVAPISAEALAGVAVFPGGFCANLMLLLGPLVLNDPFRSP